MYDQILTIVLEVVKVLIALLALGFGTERGTQIVKELLRFIGAKFPVLDFSNSRSFILAAVVAFSVTYFFGVDLTKFLPILDGFDARLVEMITALLTLVFSNKLHDKYFPSSAG